MVGGSDSLDTLLMTAYPGLLVKGGADGVHALALPDGRAVAFKIADGGDRARLPIITAALRFLGVETGRRPGSTTDASPPQHGGVGWWPPGRGRDRRAGSVPLILVAGRR